MARLCACFRSFRQCCRRLFYTTSDFSAVKLKGDYTGGTDYKDVFCGQAALDLSPYRCQSEAGHREEMQLERPLAKVELITTDIVKYLNKLEQTKSIRDAAIDDFTVQVLYTGYFPVGFNVVSNRPNEAVMGHKVHFQPSRPFRQ